MKFDELLESLKPKFENILNEENDIGVFISTGGEWEVEVYYTEGHYPHCHVTTPWGAVSAPRLDIPGYFIHEGKRYIMNAQERKEFDKFMRQRNKKEPTLTNWQYCSERWNAGISANNRNNEVNCSNLNNQPNYRALPSQEGSKHKRR